MNAGPLSAAIERFIDYLRNERRYSPATIANYTRSLNQLCAHIETLRIARWREMCPQLVVRSTLRWLFEAFRVPA